MADDTARPDLGAISAQVKVLLEGLRDDQLADPTPCEDTPVAQLLDHLVSLTLAFRLAAEKSTGEFTANAPRSSAAHLDPAWRSVLPRQLDDLTAAWRKPDAWIGKTQAGGMVLPAAVMGAVAVNELVLHGWDLARATAQAYDPDPAAVAVSLSLFPEGRREGSPGMFKPSVPVPDDAPALDQAVAASGRDPGWAP